MFPSAVTCVLLAIWPLLNFVSHNKHQMLDFQPILVAGLGSVVAALALAGVIRLGSIGRISTQVALPMGGLIVALFWSFDVVESGYVAAGVGTGTELATWAALAVGAVAFAGWAVRRPPVLRAVAFSTSVLAAMPALDFAQYAVRHYEFGGPALAATTTTADVAAADPALRDLPNVYFFILDMYSRDDALRDFYHHDNADFLSFLESRGFRIARNSFSNYGNTEASVTSTLFMDYFMPIVNDGTIEDGTPTFRDPDSAVPLVKPVANMFAPEAAAIDAGTYGWQAVADNSIANVNRTLEIAKLGGDDSEMGATLWLNQEHGLMSDLLPGGHYRLSAQLKVTGGNGIRMVVGGAGVDRRTDIVIAGHDFEEHSLDFVATSATEHRLSMEGMNTGNYAWLDDLTLRLEPLPRGAEAVLSRVRFDFQPGEDIFRVFQGSEQHLSPVLRTFRELGYQVLFANIAGTGSHDCDPYCLKGEQNLTFQQVELIKMTPLYAYAARFRPDIWRDLTQFYQKNPLWVVQQIPDDVPEPFYLHAHILAPHPPFLYRPDCSIRDDFLFELEPDVDLFGTGDEMHAMYVEQLTCVNELVKQTVAELQERDPEAIVIFQGDHGLGKLTTIPSLFDGTRARYGILNAWHLPDACADRVYDDITPINTFRLVFACLSGTEPNFVPDRLFENSSYHRRTRDITANSRPTPQSTAPR